MADPSPRSSPIAKATGRTWTGSEWNKVESVWDERLRVDDTLKFPEKMDSPEHCRPRST